MVIRRRTAWNGLFDCTRYQPNFLFNQFGMLERCALRNGNIHSADDRREVLDPIIAGMLSVTSCGSSGPKTLDQLMQFADLDVRRHVTLIMSV